MSAKKSRQKSLESKLRLLGKRNPQEGFRSGYYAVMQGKGTRPPTLPPRKYWSACNMKEDCKARTLSWFNGYASGANVAMGDGVENHCRITTAEQLYRKPPTEISSELNHPSISPEELEPVEPEPVPALVPPVSPQETIPPPPLIEKISHEQTLPPNSSANTKKLNQTQYIQTLDLFEHGTKIKKMSFQTTTP
ncbi:hypothetical protein OAF42_00205 [Planctomicrobium sp.]|nr:hypothetical protein [Planctomicrobium sp.]MDB4732840.1 hypothetical protein [Planctomicrobium sp.]